MTKQFAIMSNDFDGELRRNINLQLESAQAALARVTEQHQEGVHEARKSFKRLRGVFNLLQHTNKSLFKEYDLTVKKIARTLAACRDDFVLSKTLEKIFSRNPELKEYPQVKNFYTELKTNARQTKTPIEKTIGTASIPLQKFLTIKPAKKLPTIDRKALLNGLKSNYIACKKYWKHVSASHDSEEFHYWRKLTKYHFYQIQLFQKTYPDASSRLHQLDILCELLGDHHDLVILQEKLNSSNIDCKLLEKTIQKQQQKLEHKALKKGEQLFAEKPDKVMRKLEKYLINTDNK